MPKYLVIGNIKRGGKILPLNKPAEFEEEDAAPLLRDGFLAALPASAPAKAEKVASDDAASGDAGTSEEAGSKGKGKGVKK